MKKIDYFVMRDSHGHTIRGYVYRDSDMYVLAVTPLFSGYKRFNTLDAVYAFCEGRGLHVGDRADMIRKRDRTVSCKHVASSGLPEHVRQRLIKDGHIKKMASEKDGTPIYMEIR